MKRFLVLAILYMLAVVEATSAECAGWGGFRAPVRYSSSADQAILVHDFDGDGHPDLVASGNHVDQVSALSLFANRGDGRFAPELLVTTGSGEKVEDIGDLNGDGIPDLLTSSYWSNGIVAYRGLGNLRFDGGTRYETATHGGPSFFENYDHDQAADVISLSFGSGNPVRVHLFRGSGDGTLASKVTFETALANGSAPSVRHRDGVLEILVCERSGHLAILR